MAEWCIQCARPCTVLDPVTGWCVVCTEKVQLERQRRLDAEDEARLAAEEAKAVAQIEREVDAIKKARQRRRDEREPDRVRRHPPFRRCQGCGERLPARPADRDPLPADDFCVTCWGEGQSDEE